MKEVIDRVPTRPNRIKLTSESDGSINYYAWERADEPITDGTPINKELFDSIGTDITSLQQTTSKNTSDIATNKSDIATNTTSIANLNNATRINLLKPTLQTQTVNGVTITNNGDGTYTFIGDCTASEWVVLNIMSLPKGKYKFVGLSNNANANARFELWKDNSELLVRNNNIFVLNEDTSNIYVEINITGTDSYDLLLKPMITTNLNATYDDFVSYEDSLATNRVIATRVNLLVPALQTQTQNGVTCTNNGDGTYTLNGTATAPTSIHIGSVNGIKNYRLCGNPETVDCSLYIVRTDTWKTIADDKGFGTNLLFELNVLCNINIWFAQGKIFNNLILKPMITTNLNATYNDFISCLGTTWTQDTTNGYYTQSIICSGITSNDNPTIDVVLSGALAEMQAQQDEWGKILKIETLTDTLKFYASEPTTVSLSVMVKGV